MAMIKTRVTIENKLIDGGASNGKKCLKIKCGRITDGRWPVAPQQEYKLASPWCM